MPATATRRLARRGALANPQHPCRGAATLTPNPYKGLPDHAFWRRAMAAGAAVDPVVTPRFTIGKADRVATAGSCFAQHLSRRLAGLGFRHLVTEQGPAARGFGVFTARYGNVYTPRQLLQLFRRAYALFEPAAEAWERPDGRLVDPFRPQAEPEGFADLDALRADRAAHLGAVREMFETCDLLVLTLGLTEGWEDAADGAVYPLAPGVVAAPASGGACFRNFTVAEMLDDLSAFTEGLRLVNPGARLLLTVSPVPLIATAEPRHVLVSTVASKSALRVVADEAQRRDPGTDYFPAYEIVTGPQTGGRWFAADLRSVTEAGVDAVMAVFARHYLAGDPAPRAALPAPAVPAAAPEELAALAELLCDEEAIIR